MDADGYMLTEKRWEEVSCSSEDESKKDDVIMGTPKESLKSKPKTTSTAFTKKPLANKKQSSLMGFFSKKTSK